MKRPGAGSPDGISDEANLMTAVKLDIRGSKRMEKSGLTNHRIPDWRFEGEGFEEGDSGKVIAEGSSAGGGSWHNKFLPAP